jgi:hypothetical protein
VGYFNAPIEFAGSDSEKQQQKLPSDQESPGSNSIEALPEHKCAELQPEKFYMIFFPYVCSSIG